MKGGEGEGGCRFDSAEETRIEYISCVLDLKTWGKIRSEYDVERV